MFNRAKMLLCLCLVMLAMVAMSAVALAEDGVDWETSKIEATGLGMAPENVASAAQGKMLARRAAMLDAYRQLGEIVNGVSLDSETTVQNMMVVSDVTKTHVNVVIKGAQITEEYATEDGGYAVTLALPLYGTRNSLASAVMKNNTAREAFPPLAANVTPTPAKEVSLYPDQVAAQPVLPTPTVAAPGVTAPVPGSSTPAVTAPQLTTPAAALAKSAVGGYTGLIVDCSGLGLRPAMSPVIKNDQGTPIYGYKNLNSQTVINKGMAGYTTDINNASRAGSNPLVVRAVSLDGANPVISTADANRVLLENSATGFLEATNVVFVR